MRISKSNKTIVNANNRDISRRSADFMRNRLMEKGYSKEEVNNMGLIELKKACEDEGIELVMNCNDVKSVSSTDKALKHIKAAIDILGKSGNRDAVTKDSIANLATVMFDIKGSTLLAAKQLSANGLSKGMTIKDIDDGQEFTVGRVEKGEKPNTFDVYDSNDDFVGTYDNAPQFERVD